MRFGLNKPTKFQHFLVSPSQRNLLYPIIRVWTRGFHPMSWGKIDEAIQMLSPSPQMLQRLLPREVLAEIRRPTTCNSSNGNCLERNNSLRFSSVHEGKAAMANLTTMIPFQCSDCILNVLPYGMMVFITCENYLISRISWWYSLDIRDILTIFNDLIVMGVSGHCPSQPRAAAEMEDLDPNSPRGPPSQKPPRKKQLAVMQERLGGGNQWSWSIMKHQYHLIMKLNQLEYHK